MPATPYVTYATLQRNDAEGALALAQRLLDANRYTPDDAETLIMLQDDPTALLARLAPMYAASVQGKAK